MIGRHNFQVRLAEDVYGALKEMADDGDKPVAMVIRDSIEMYAAIQDFIRQGRRIYCEDPQTGDRSEILIPGLSLRLRRKEDR